MRCGLIGEKLGHSHSKTLHGLLADYRYDLIELAPEELGPFLKKGEFDGLNVTIPYKQAVIPYLRELSPTAQAIGSVNTIVRRPDGTLFGDNTDAYGLGVITGRAGMAFAGTKTLILGSGGTSRTARHVVEAAGGEAVTVSRTGETNYENLERHADAAWLINATPVGMYPRAQAAPVDLARLTNLRGVADVIYNPLRTRLLQQAQDLGIPCANGLRMLVAQAKAAAEHFLGAPLPDAGTDRVYGELAREMRSLALIGMPSCGKTTLGRLLAAHMGRELVDLDEKIARDAGLSIPEIFAREGETGFRARETAALREVAGRQGLVVATGGGIVKNPENVRLLRANAAVCFVQRGLARLSSADPSRPLSTSAEALARMYAERLPLYTAAADFSVSNDGAAEETARAIEDQFKEMCR